MLRKKRLISCLLMSIIVIALCFTGCAKEQTPKSEEKKEEDLSWFDAQSHELIRIMTDMTTELFISEYLDASENGTEQEKTIESGIMTTTYFWPKEYEPITMPS